MYIYPPKVTHINSRAADNRGELCSLCGSSLHMSKGEVKLLRYYAEQANGFKPALQHIANTLGITRRHVERARKMLELHGVIRVDDERVYIDWERIRLFSTLDPACTSKHCFIAPVKLQKCPHKVYIPDKSLLLKLRTCSQEDACKTFSGMTEEQFRAVQHRFSAA